MAHKKLYLSFFWHMHQPYYKDDATGQYMMPWVFLHAIKDYYELPWYLERKNRIKASFNVVPSLIAQLKEYESENVNCLFVKAVKKEVGRISKKDRVYLIENLFHSNPKTMIHPLKRYHELFNKKNRYKDPSEAAENFTDRELLDLEILFLLSWCGNSLREKNEVVKRLIEQGDNYTENDKTELFAALFSFIKEIIPYYKKLQDEGKISVATTPFYHPILPLLIDKSSAKEAYEDVLMPKSFANFANDAEVHVKDAVSLYKTEFGRAPSGFWPAEGSVNMAALSMLAANGIKWAATDQDILFKSTQDKYKYNLYKRYMLHTSSGDIGLVFRDKKLSDLIGFTYSSWDAQAAARDFMDKLKDIFDNVGFSPLVPVILDGENAWEFYSNNGFDFFDALYNEIERCDWIEMLTLDETFAHNEVPQEELYHLKAGSWIYGTFSTWIGQAEKNEAWELLSFTKNYVEANKQLLDKKKQEKVLKELMIAEGSDWFWWYGDDHYTPLADQFDSLFRKHLINIFEIFKVEVPDKLYKPIIKSSVTPYKFAPKNFLTPKINGRNSSYYEWQGCGIVELGFDFSAMDSSGFHLKTLKYGYDYTNLYVGLCGNFVDLIDKNYKLGISFVGSQKFQLLLPFRKKIDEIECVGFDGAKECVEASVDEMFEVKIPKACIHKECEERVELYFEIFKEGNMIERSPVYSIIELDISNDFVDDWYI